MTLPLAGPPPPIRLEITCSGQDADGRPGFELVFVDEGERSVVWSGSSYEQAILEAGAWEADDVEVIDRVADGVAP